MRRSTPNDLKARWNASRAPAAEKAGEAISAWAAEECNRFSAQDFMGEEAELHGGPVSAATERGLNTWVKFKVFQPMKGRTPSVVTADTRWALNRKIVDGKKDVKARHFALNLCAIRGHVARHDRL